MLTSDMQDRPPPLAQDDIALLDEIDEMFRNRLAELERSGASRETLNTLADRYGRMNDLVDALFTATTSRHDSIPFRRETYQVLADGILERIHVVYDPEYSISEAQADTIIRQTRQKLQRIRKVLFSLPG